MHLQDMLKANEADPYDHDEYTRHLNMAKAACLLLCEGDYLLAGALMDAFHGSNESMSYYTKRFTRAQLLDFAHIDESVKSIPSTLPFRIH